jgi:hypothetical protein
MYVHIGFATLLPLSIAVAHERGKGQSGRIIERDWFMGVCPIKGA